MEYLPHRGYSLRDVVPEVQCKVARAMSEYKLAQAIEHRAENSLLRLPNYQKSTN